MRKLIFGFVVAGLFSCGPDDEVGPCSLRFMNKDVRTGWVHLCNADPNNVQYFESWVEIASTDSTISLHLSSVDPNQGFTYSVDSLIYRCGYLEDELTYSLYLDASSNQEIGRTNGVSYLFLSLYDHPYCPISCTFDSSF
jgi:hypothetical protein